MTNLEAVSVPLAISQVATSRIGLAFVAGQLPNAQLLPVSPLQDVNKYLEDAGAHMRPPLGIGALLAANNTVYALFNGAAHHSPPAAVLLVTNAMINKRPGIS